MKLSILLILITLFLTRTVLSSIIRVPQDQPSIQSGINAAIAGDTVLVADSTYYENINFKGKAITVASYYLIDKDTSHITSTIIDGSQPVNPDSGSVVTFVSGEDTTSVLCGLTLRGGNGTYTELYDSRNGGGIFCWDSGCKIVNNIITSNSAVGVIAGGGGLAALPVPCLGYVILKDNVIRNNVASASSGFANGGGLKIYGDGEIRDNLIANNICYSNQGFAGGGGIDCWTDDFVNPPKIIVLNNDILHNSVISDAYDSTTAQAQGGGLRLRGYDALVKGNNFKGNTATSFGLAAGGAIRITYSGDSAVINGNVITENETSGRGGGLNINHAYPILSNNIIDNNTGDLGGGIAIYEGDSCCIVNNTILDNDATTAGGGLESGFSDIVLMNNIIWGNQAPVDSQIQVYGGNVEVLYCDVQGGWPGEGNRGVEPQFVPNDSLFHLAGTDTACINRGIDSLLISGSMYYCPPFDYDGDQRPFLITRPDIGADETDVITEIEPLSAIELPKSYQLFQNYPNPFNPITIIEFTLPKSSKVSLKVFNILGEEVATLLSASLLSGSHSVQWDASDLASGVYLYRLEAEGFVETRKMVLMR